MIGSYMGLCCFVRGYTMLVSMEFGCSVCDLQIKHGHIKHLPLYVLNKRVEANERYALDSLPRILASDPIYIHVGSPLEKPICRLTARGY